MSTPITDKVPGGINAPVHFDEDGFKFGTGASTSGVFHLGETLTGIRLVLRAEKASTLGTSFAATLYGGDVKDAAIGGTDWTALKTFSGTGTFAADDEIDAYYPPTGTSKKYWYVAVTGGATGGELGVWNELIPGR